MAYFNEFFTPPELIEKMLSHIPDHLWNIHTKWLEPTCGDGSFMMFIFNKLFHETYVSEYLDEEERVKRIHDNLYMVDINPQNIEKTRQKMGLGSSCPHIFCVDFLSWQSVSRFDVIVGNPPFQNPSNSYLNGSLRTGSGKKMYEKIIERALTFLQDGGHLCFISPLNLWSGSNKIYKKIVDNYYPKFIYLDNVKKKWFPRIGQNLKMCFFVVSKESRGLTIIETDKTYEIELKNINPVEDWTPENIRLLETYLTHKPNKFVGTTKKNNLFEETTSGYPLIQNPQRVFHVLKNEELLKRSAHGIEKIILFRMKPFELGMYDKGDLLLSSEIYFLPLTEFTKEEKENIITFFQSDIYKKMVSITTTSQFLKGGLVNYLDIEKIKSQEEGFQFEGQPNKIPKQVLDQDS